MLLDPIAGRGGPRGARARRRATGSAVEAMGSRAVASAASTPLIEAAVGNEEELASPSPPAVDRTGVVQPVHDEQHIQRASRNDPR